MQTHTRKLVTIITEAVIEDELGQELQRLGASGFTVIDARGKGHSGDRNTGWEHGANIQVEVICEDSLARAIVDCLEERYYANYAMIIFLTDVEILRPEKFKSTKGKMS